MNYLVLTSVEEAILTNEKQETPSSAYGETYPEARKEDAFEYFKTCLSYFLDRFEELQAKGLKSVLIMFALLEWETDKEPKEILLTVEMSGKVLTVGGTQAESHLKDIEKALDKAGYDNTLIRRA